MLTSATNSEAKPSAPIRPGTSTPSESSPVIASTTSTVTAALTMLFAAMIRERSSGRLYICRIA